MEDQEPMAARSEIVTTSIIVLEKCSKRVNFFSYSTYALFRTRSHVFLWDKAVRADAVIFLKTWLIDFLFKRYRGDLLVGWLVCQCYWGTGVKGPEQFHPQKIGISVPSVD